MEDDMEADASCVPPRLEGQNEIPHIHDNDNGQGHQHQPEADNGHNQEENHAHGEETSVSTHSVLSDVDPPHNNWAYNRLLVDISKALTEDDLKVMKRMYTGDIGPEALDQITDVFDLFSAMEKRLDLSSINLLKLGSLLYIADRVDLMREVATYSRKTEDALYLEQPKRSHVNGYIYVDFHVAGRDFTKTTQKDLRDFTKIVTTLLKVEEQFVKFAGVKPACSIKITILLREQDVTALQTVLEGKDSMDSKSRLVLLVFYGVDTVVIGDKTFRIQDAFSAPIEDDEQMQLDMHQQLQKYKHAFGKTELENLTLKHKVLQLQAENDVWIHSAKPDYISPDARKGHGQDKTKQPVQDDIKTALEIFKGSLAKISHAKYDKQLVLELLQAHVTLIASRCYHELSSIIVQSNMQLKNIFHDSVMAATRGEVHRFIGISDDIQDPLVRALREISSKLTQEEKQKLQNEYHWTKDEKESTDKGNVPFFFILLRKEHENVGRDGVDLTEFLPKCLTKIGRLDLWQVFVEELRKPIVSERRQQPTEDRKTSTDKHEGKEQTMDELMQYVKLLVVKVDQIDSNLKAINRTHSVENLMDMKEEYTKFQMFHKFVV